MAAWAQDAAGLWRPRPAPQAPELPKAEEPKGDCVESEVSVQAQPVRIIVPAALLSAGEDATRAVAALVERLQQRPPGELRQETKQDQKRQNGPDEEPGVGLDQWVIHGTLPLCA